MQQVQEILKNCSVKGTIVYLPPGQLDRKLYHDVAKSLELIGGKWKGGKIMGFVFPANPSELLEQIANGEKRNLKKEFQYFATPDSIADEMVRYADIKDADIVLEPSAGQGAIIKAIHRQHPAKRVLYFELMDINRTVLSGIPNTFYCGSDFLTCKDCQFDKIIANPPFAKNQDIDHIYKMWEVLKPGGKIVTIASKHWLLSANKKETAFKEWIYDTVEADVNTIEAGAFEESGTKIETVLIEINK